MRPDPTPPADALPSTAPEAVEVAGWRFDPVAQRLSRGDETRTLLMALFPKQASNVWGIN